MIWFIIAAVYFFGLWFVFAMCSAARLGDDQNDKIEAELNRFAPDNPRGHRLAELMSVHRTLK